MPRITEEGSPLHREPKIAASALPCRLIIDPPASGAWNMAVDEALLESARRQGRCMFRLYRWERATLSLGYFQYSADRQLHPTSSRCPLVRRHSGGGAILHDHELTYCLVMPTPVGNPRHAAGLYRSVHGTLVEAFQALGISAQFQSDTRKKETEPFLCFQRRSEGDLLIGQTKIVGSAQRRQKGVLMQHGSILLQSSIEAPELRGIRELTGQTVSAEELWSHWAPRLMDGLLGSMRQDRLEPQELNRVECIASEKYSAASWTQRR